jgi:hypothetical protein
MNDRESFPTEDEPHFRSARRLSEVLDELAQEANGPVSIATTRDALGDRSFAALLVLFAAVNLLPWPPGSTLVLGLPLILVSGQMVLGRTSTWLPQFVLEKSLSPDRFRRIAETWTPRLMRLERLVKPRYWPFYPGYDDRVIGMITLIEALAVTLPVPFGNWFPALSIVFLGLALSERDGVLLAIGIVVGAFALAVMAFVVGSAGFLAHLIFS